MCIAQGLIGYFITKNTIEVACKYYNFKSPEAIDSLVWGTESLNWKEQQLLEWETDCALTLNSYCVSAPSFFSTNQNPRLLIVLARFSQVMDKCSSSIVYGTYFQLFIFSQNVAKNAKRFANMHVHGIFHFWNVLVRCSANKTFREE